MQRNWFISPALYHEKTRHWIMGCATFQSCFPGLFLDNPDRCEKDLVDLTSLKYDYPGKAFPSYASWPHGIPE